MNKYQACAHYHTANGFLPAKQAEELQENKEALIIYVQTCALSKIINRLENDVLDDICRNAPHYDVINHLLECDDEDSDELEEVIQILTDKQERDEITRWYRFNN